MHEKLDKYLNISILQQNSIHSIKSGRISGSSDIPLLKRKNAEKIEFLQVVCKEFNLI